MNLQSLKPAKSFANGGIYCIFNTASNKIYVGSAINIKEIVRNHKKYLTANRHPNKHMQSSWNQSTLDFQFLVIEIVEDNTKLLEREQYWIDFYEAFDNKKGYNKRRIPNSNIGLKFHSEEYKKNLSERMKGHTFNKGRKVSEEHRKKISLALKGRKHSKEHIEKRMVFKRGVPVSEEQKRKISKTLQGNTNATGHKVSNEAKRIMSLSTRNIDKWPHALGSSCKCDECKNKLKIIRHNKYQESKNEFTIIKTCTIVCETNGG